MASARGDRRKEAFDDVAELYDRARPGYPDDLIADLATVANLGPGSRVLEIGCGTGQLTVPLARLGVRLVAVELGANLATLARRNLAGFPAAEVVNAAFEAWPLPDESFDAVVCATAFHWLDPDLRVSKSAAALRPGGSLAVIDTHHVAGGTTGFDAASQRCYVRWDPEAQPGFRPPAVHQVQARDDLNGSAMFASVVTRRYVRDLEYTTGTYLDLLGTYSNIRGMADDARDGLLSCLADLIDSRFGGRISKTYVSELRIAVRCDATAVPGKSIQTTRTDRGL